MCKPYVKVSQTGPSGPLRGHSRSLGAKSSKEATGGPWGHNVKLALDILELMMKKKDLSVFNGSFETCNRYNGNKLGGHKQ